MSSGVDFSAARNAASDLLVADSTDADANLSESLVVNARRLLELTDVKVSRTPGQDAELLATLDALRSDERFGGDRSSYHRAHEALDRLIQARGAESGRPPAAEPAAKLAGSAPPSAVPAATVSFTAARQAAGDRLQFILDDPKEDADRERLLRFMALTHPSYVRSSGEDRELLALLAGLRDQPPPSTTSAERGVFAAAHRAFETSLSPVDPNVVAVMGAGKMGSDIAYALLSAGFTVRVYDVQPGQVEKSQEYVLGMIEKGIRTGRISREQGSEIALRLQYYSGPELLSAAVNGAGYVMEAVFESYDVKIPLFRQLNAVAHPDTIFLTNTSTLSVTKLAQESGRPDRFAGVHFFWPAYSNPLLELTFDSWESAETRGSVWSAPAHVRTLGHAFGERLGKVVLETPDRPGFIANRFFVPWAVEGACLLDKLLAEYRDVHPEISPDEEEAVAQELQILIDDATKKAFGVGLGPFRIMNETGPIIHYDSAMSLAQLGDYYKPAPALSQMIEGTPKGERPLWSLPTSNETDKRKKAKEIAGKEAALLASIKARLGDGRYVELHKVIGDRILGLTFRIAGALQREGIPMDDIDRAARVGLAWPEGPFALMRRIGFDRAKALADAVSDLPETDFFTRVGFAERLNEIVDRDVSTVSLNVDESTGIGRIKIERPSKLNVLDPQVVADLTRRFDEAEKDARVKMIVLEGVGGNLAGADIGFFVENLKKGKEGLQTIMDFVQAGLDLYSRIEKSEKRVVAVLDGNTFGGGFELALAAHDIIVTPQAKLALPETSLGIIPGLRGADRLAKRVGTGVAFWMMVTGDSGENAISGADLAAFEASISLVERTDLEEKLRKFAAGERNSLIRDQNPTQRRYDAIGDLFGFSARGSQMRQDVMNGIEHPELAGEAKEIYDKALVLAAKRPRAALQLANQLLEVDSDDDDYRIVEQVFLTPMALQGLTSMGRKIEVETWTPAQWDENLLRLSYAQFEHVLGTTLVLKLNKIKPTADEVQATAHVIRNRLNALMADGKLNDISRVQLFYEKDGSEPQALVIQREGPGGHFAIVVQPIKGGPTGQGDGGPSSSPPRETPSSSGVSGTGSRLSTVAQGRDDIIAGMTVGESRDDGRGEHVDDSQQPSGRPDRLREQGIGRGSQGPEVDEREDRRPQRRGSSGGKQDDRGHTASVRLVSTSALVTGAVHLVGGSDADAEVTERRPTRGPRATTVKRVVFPTGAGLPPVARPAGMPVLFR